MNEHLHPHFPLEDLDRALSTLLTLGRYIGTTEAVPASISVFASESAQAALASPSRYELRILNNELDTRWFCLVIDIHKKSDTSLPYLHGAHFEKAVCVGGRSSEVVSFVFDWLKWPLFTINGVKFGADAGWCNSFETPATYLVKAQLLDELRKTPLEELVLQQELLA
jgi:hypothetical protein